MKRCKKLEEIVEKVKEEFPGATISISYKNATIGIYITPIVTATISIYIEWWDSFKVTITRYNLDSWDILKDTFVVNEIFMIKPLLPDDIKKAL